MGTLAERRSRKSQGVSLRSQGAEFFQTSPPLAGANPSKVIRNVN